MEVEEQEPGDRARQRETHPRDEWLRDLRKESESSECDRGDSRNAGREPVKTVDEVQRVVHTHDPQHRERDGDGE